MGQPQTARVVLLHVRDDAEEKEIERRAFLRTAGIADAFLESVDALPHPPSVSLLDRADALIVGGSPCSVSEDMSTYEALAALVRAAAERGIPTLGVCFGAQLIARAFGGEVVRDKEHEEVGTHVLRTVSSAAGDALFGALPGTFLAQCAHNDRIARVPDGAVMLAETDACPIQAFRMPGGFMYGIQFHPERSKEDFQRFIFLRKVDYGGDREVLDAAYRELRDTPEAAMIVRRFVQGTVGRV